MTRRFVVNGKVMRAPSLGAYDNRKYAPDEPHNQPVNQNMGWNTKSLHAPFGDSLRFNKDAPRTQHRDYALLVSLGVNGEVPLAQARVNAGLDPGLGMPKKRFEDTFSAQTVLLRHFFGANDNEKISAAIAA